MDARFQERIESELEQFKRDGVYKRLNTLEGPQAPRVKMRGYGEVIVLSSNNYLGFANQSDVKAAAKAAIDRYGNGTASVRFICGTLAIHEELETATAKFLQKEASTTYTSCWNANEALFATFLGEEDLIVSDALNHASIIDGIRLIKKVRKEVYPHNDMQALEEILKSAANCRTKMIVTDGVFSMEGHIAKLPEICDLAKKYNALVVIDDSHATGVLGKTGRGSPEHYGLMKEIDIITGTYGKALGGAAGGFIAGPKAVVDYCVQRSRPQLFSNALPPSVAAASLTSIRYLEAHPERVQKLRENTVYFRKAVKEAGFKPLEGETPIVPIIVGETSFAIKMSEQLLQEGVFVTGFGFPVVPKGEARLRIQISAAHEKKDFDEALAAFRQVGKKLGVIH
ncbi:MAG TPA: glycine C-acetyltransferase [Bdellovibrionota bacterium]|nr:glycine C-acetyltransferase [Bdellovibrionota bacterium]